MEVILKVGVFGEGTYTHELAAEEFPNGDFVFLTTPRDVIDAVVDGKADVGLIPFYNLHANTEGVPVGYRDLLIKDVLVRKVLPKRISVCCAGVDGMSVDHIRQLFLMSVLRPQCSDFIRSLGDGVALIHEGIDKTPRAFARALEFGYGSAALGRNYRIPTGLKVLQVGVENEGNVTFFFMVDRNAKGADVSGDRTLLCCEISGMSSLQQATSVLSSALRAQDVLVYQLWCEDRTKSLEANHLLLVEVDLPQDGYRDDSFSLECEGLLRWKNLGSVSPWRLQESL